MRMNKIEKLKLYGILHCGGGDDGGDSGSSGSGGWSSNTPSDDVSSGWTSGGWSSNTPSDDVSSGWTDDGSSAGGGWSGWNGGYNNDPIDGGGADPYCYTVQRTKKVPYTVTETRYKTYEEDTVDVVFRSGTRNQDVTPYFNEIIDTNNVNTRLSNNNTNINYFTKSNALDSIGVGIVFPRGLFYTNDKGKRTDHTLEYRVKVTNLTDNTVSTKDITVTDSSMDPIRRYTEVNLYPAPTAAKVEVILLTYLEDSSRYAQDIVVEYIDEVVDQKLAYPNTALFGIRALATDNLSGGLPRVVMEARRDIMPITKPDGNEILVPATNPAWACYELLTNHRYGGSVNPIKVDFDAFSRWASYCDSKNLTVNIYLDSSTTLYTCLNRIATLGRGSVVLRGTKYGCMWDGISEPVQMFNVANIVSDSFKEDFITLEDRANVINVIYNDADYDYRKRVVKLRQDYAGDYQTDDKEIEVNLIGCTDRSMAVNYAKYLLNCNKYLNRTIEWQSDVDAIACQPADVVLFQHDVPRWGEGGRVVEADGSTIVLDKEIEFESGVEYTIVVRHSENDVLEQRRVLPTTSPNSIIKVSSPWSKEVKQDDIWVLGVTNATIKKYRVISVTRSTDLICTIKALEYNEDVYKDSADIDDIGPINLLKEVNNLVVQEVWELNKDGKVVSNAYVKWSGSAIAWDVFYRKLNQKWVYVGNTRAPSIKIPNLSDETNYQISVTANGNPDDGETSIISIRGKEAPPSNVEDFVASLLDQKKIAFTWSHIPDYDLFGYVIREGVDWDSGRTVVDLVQENYAEWEPPVDGTYQFHIRAIDTSGNYSKDYATQNITVDIEGSLNIVNDTQELDTVSGIKYDLLYCDATNKLILAETMTDTDCPAAHDTTLNYDGNNDGFAYYISPEYDLGAVTTVTIRTSTGFHSIIRQVVDTVIGERTDTTYPNDTDTNITSYAYIKSYYSISEDGIEWSDFKPITKAISVNTRYYKYKWEVYISIKSTYLEITSLRHIVDVPEKFKKIVDMPISSGGGVFTLTDYNIRPIINYYVGVTVLGTVPKYPVIDKQGSSFTVQLYDQNGSPISGDVDINIVYF